MSILKPVEEQQKSGLKTLFFGATGTGKTLAGLTFPKIASIDTEDGQVFYMKHKEYGKNLVSRGVTNSVKEVEEVLDELEENIDMFQTLLIDSETKLYENLQHVMLDIAEDRARANRRSADAEGLSVKEWGKIKQVTKRIQNLKIMLASKGINVVSIAQESDVKEKKGDSFVIVGHKPDVAKGIEFDYDIIVRFITVEEYGKGGVKEIKYKGEVVKDRTQTYQKGDVIDNPSFENWKSAWELGQSGEDMNLNLNNFEQKDAEMFAEQDEIDKVVSEIKKLAQTSKSAQTALVALAKEGKIPKDMAFSDIEEARGVLKTLKGE